MWPARLAGRAEPALRVPAALGEAGFDRWSRSGHRSPRAGCRSRQHRPGTPKQAISAPRRKAHKQTSRIALFSSSRFPLAAFRSMGIIAPSTGCTHVSNLTIVLLLSSSNCCPAAPHPAGSRGLTTQPYSALKLRVSSVRIRCSSSTISLDSDR